MPTTLSDIVKHFTDTTTSKLIDDVVNDENVGDLNNTELQKLVGFSNASEAALIKILAQKNADNTVVEAVINRKDFLGTTLSKGQSEKVITAITSNPTVLDLDAAQLMLLAKHPNANENALIKIVQASNDPAVLSAVIDRNKRLPHNVTDEILKKLNLLPEKSLMKLIQNHYLNAEDHFLTISKNTKHLSILKEIVRIFNYKEINTVTTQQVISDLIDAILKNPLHQELTPEELTTLAKHPYTQNTALVNIANNPKKLSVLQSIINRNNFSDLPLTVINTIITNTFFNQLTTENLIKLANHLQTDDAMLIKIINKAQDVGVFQAIIAKQPKSATVMQAITGKMISDKKGALTALILNLNKNDLINLAKNPNISTGAISSIISHSKADLTVWQQIITNHPDRLEDIMYLGDKSISKGDQEKLLSFSLKLSKTKDDTPTAPSPTQHVVPPPNELDQFFPAAPDVHSEHDKHDPENTETVGEMVLEESDEVEADAPASQHSPLTEFEKEFSPQWATKIIDENNEFSSVGWTEYFASDEGKKTLTVTKLEHELGHEKEVPPQTVSLDYKTTGENSGTVFKKNDPNTPIMHISGKTLSFVGNADENVAMAVKSLNAISQANLASKKYRRISFPESAFKEEDILRILYQINAQHLNPNSTDKCNVEILIKDDRKFSTELLEIIEQHNKNARQFQGQPTTPSPDALQPSLENVLEKISQAKAQEKIPITPRSQTSDDSLPATDKRRDSTDSSDSQAKKEERPERKRRGSTGDIPTSTDPTLTVVHKQRRSSLQ